jgi:hypothetical protein
MKIRNEVNKDVNQLMNAKLVNERAYETCEFTTIRGQCFEEQDGSRFWRINVCFYASDQPSQAWIVGGEGFRSVATARQLLTPTDSFFEVVLGKIITNLDPALKQSVLEAIQRWENEPARCNSI